MKYKNIKLPQFLFDDYLHTTIFILTFTILYTILSVKGSKYAEFIVFLLGFSLAWLIKQK